MNDHDYRFTLRLKVEDPVALLRRAQAQALAEGADPADMIDKHGKPDVPSCLVMILDPGAVAGCEVYESHAERDDDDVPSRFT